MTMAIYPHLPIISSSSSLIVLVLIIEECDVSGYFYLLFRVQNIIFEQSD